MLPVRHQLKIEFGICRPVSFKLLGLPFHSWHSAMTESMEEVLMEHPVHHNDVLRLACAMAVDLPVIERYNLLVSMPYDTINILIEAYLPFYPNYRMLLDHLDIHSDTLSYLFELPHAPSSYIVGACRDLLNDARMAKQIAAIERMLGVRWTPGMLYSKSNGDNSPKPLKNEFYAPLSLLMSDNPEKMMKHIKQQVRDFAAMEDVEEAVPTAPEIPGKDGAKPKAANVDAKGKRIIKSGRALSVDAESLITLPREEFRDLFYTLRDRVIDADAKLNRNGRSKPSEKKS